MIIGGYYRCLTGSQWTVSSSFRGAESENRRWWHFGILESSELEFWKSSLPRDAWQLDCWSCQHTESDSSANGDSNDMYFA